MSRDVHSREVGRRRLAEGEFLPILDGLGVKTFKDLKGIRGLALDDLDYLEEEVVSMEQRERLVAALARPTKQKKKDELRM